VEEQSLSSHLRRTLSNENSLTSTTTNSDDDRLVIHTFFEDLSSTSSSQGNPLLDAWKEEWSRIGFETKILTMEDARQHPLYETMKDVIDRDVDSYNKMCFYRWLAMASQAEGGWMSDYDTFPTNFPLDEGINLPNDGKFTSYEFHVPSLMSASKDEWDRVSELLIDGISRTNNTIISDMYVFQTLREEENHDIVFLPPPYNMKRGFVYYSPGTVNCREMRLGRAVHLSHWKTREAFANGKFPVEVEDVVKVPGDKHRALGAKKFLEDWRQQCGGSTWSKAS